MGNAVNIVSVFLFFLFYFNIFCLFKFGSSVLRSRRMCNVFAVFVRIKVAFVFTFYRFSSSQPDVSTSICNFLLFAFSVFRRFLVLV